MDNVIISLSDVNKHYYNGKIYTKVLNNINLEVKHGEFVTIEGVSGSGKSTLLNLIGCIDKPTSGKLEIYKNDTTKLSDRNLAFIRRKYIGFIFQLFNLIPTLSVFDNIWYSQYIRKLPYEPKKILEVAELVGLEDFLQKRPDELSGGQAQKVAIARAIVSRPDIILADEPTANLDSFNTKRILELLVTLQKNLNLTVILVTHDRFNSSDYGRSIYMQDGRLIS
jgi:ABC-type lipoprotein export system ATPase subunit